MAISLPLIDPKKRGMGFQIAFHVTLRRFSGVYPCNFSLKNLSLPLSDSEMVLCVWEMFMLFYLHYCLCVFAAV